MKLSASILATLCAVSATGCEPIYMAPPATPTQPVEMAPVDPRIETIEGVEFAQPPPDHQPAVAPVAPRRQVVRPLPPPPPPQPQIQRRDPCPACGMG